MNVATITVSDILASAVKCSAIPAATVGATVTFEFTDPKWNNLSKTAVFRGCVTRDVLMTGNTVTIPQEVVAEKGPCLEIGVYGINAAGNLAIPTLWASVGYILDSADPSGDPAADPSLPIWAQLQEQIRTSSGKKINYSDLNNKPRINGVVLSGDQSLEALGIGQPTQGQIGTAVFSYLDAHPEATTTVQDGSISQAKLSSDVRQLLSGSAVFSGKTASFYGDSLTEVNSHYTKGYHQWISEILGLASCRNYGVSGYKISDVYNKVKSVTDTADVIFIMCGVNDQTFSVPLGTVNDATTGTTYGALNLLCALLKRKYPTSVVVFITPHWQNKYIHSAGITSCEISRAIRAVCEKYAITVYDNYTLSGIHNSNLSVFTTDNCHWNDLGHEMVGRNLAGFMKASFAYVHGSTPDLGEDDTPVAVTGISLNSTSGMLTVGNRLTLVATVSPINATNPAVVWTSSAPGVASVSGGIVTALSQGSAVISATTEEGGFSATFQLTVNPAVPEVVTLQRITAAFNQGEAVIYHTDFLDTLRQYLAVTAVYSDGSTEPVTAYALTGTLATGISTITVTYSGKTATFTVNVTKDPYTVPSKNLEITGVKFANQWHLSLYVSREDLPALTGSVTFSFDMKPLTNFSVTAASIATGGAYTVDVPNNLLAGYTEFKPSQYPVIKGGQNGTYTVSMTRTINHTADRAYWCFPVDMNLAVGDKFLLSNYYVEVGGVKQNICSIGGAFVEETCIIT